LKGHRDGVRLMKRCKAIFLGLLVLSPVLSGDEVDKLIEEVGPAERFTSHIPNFSGCIYWNF
jgi:hypothetical protein